MAEYAIALYMRMVLSQTTSVEVTIITPNALQRDLVKEVYSKKRAVSDKFTQLAPHVISTWDVDMCLPLEVAIYIDLA